MKAIQSFEVIDHGIEHSQYFPGGGVSFTEYEHVATGIGNDAEEALDDAIEQLACSDWDVETVHGQLSEELNDMGTDSVSKLSAKNSHDNYDEHYYHVSIRVR